MLTVFVCDDERAFADLLSDKLTRIFKSLSVDADIKTFTSPKGCLSAFRGESSPDAVFLDIDMPGVSGFDIASEIKKERGGALVIFVSGKQELVFESFDYHPFSFVRKNAGADFEAELRKVCEGVVSFLVHRKPIELHDVYAGPVFVAAEDIVFVKSDDHYLEYRVAGRTRPIKERGQIKEAEKKLKPLGFIRPHSRYLVNAERISFFNPKINRIVLDTKDSVPVSRSQRDAAYGEYQKIKRVY